MDAHIKNNPRRAGQRATKLEFFCGTRYAVAAVHTRFDAVEWFVWDAEHSNATMARSEVIRQAPTRAEAIKGLDLEVSA